VRVFEQFEKVLSRQPVGVAFVLHEVSGASSGAGFFAVIFYGVSCIHLACHYELA